MWRSVIVDGVGPSTQDQASRLEPELAQSRGAREQLTVDVELTETTDYPEHGLVRTATNRTESMSDPDQDISDCTHRWVCWLLRF